MEDNVLHARRWRLFVAMLMAATLATVGLTLASPAPAEAVVVQWGTNSGTAPNYQAHVNGDFLMAGNGVLACTSAAGTGVGTCNDLHAASNSDADNVNDNFVMSNTNAAGGFTTNSSSATINVPAGATVVKAFLSWSANTGAYTGDNRSLCTTFSTARGTATLPAGSATGYLNRAVQFRVGSGGISSIAPQSMLVDPTNQATARYYSASADVTSAFAGVTFGARFGEESAFVWIPELTAGWRQAAGDGAGVTTASFVAGGPAFSLEAPDLSGGGPVVRLGLRGQGKYFDFAVEGGGEFRDDYEAYDGRVIVRFLF